jgi:hypothetical protein
MAYINAFLNHFRRVGEWASRNTAAVHLDVATFELEVKCRHRFFHFFPQFVGNSDGRLHYTPTIGPSTVGFAGWRPYRTLSLELSQDKLLFKKVAAAAGLKVPEQWLIEGPRQAPPRDYVLKRSAGSFGYQLDGPFRAGTVIQPRDAGTVDVRGTAFAEEFIRGRALKVWCWGQKAFFAHAHEPTSIIGNGVASLRQLISARLAQVGIQLEAYKETHVIDACLAYQELSASNVLPQGSPAFFDYRYGRDHQHRGNFPSDNALGEQAEATIAAIQQAAKGVANILRASLPAPVLYSLDGVIDARGEVWWLEMNSNPALPPEGYEPMFADLFA